MSTAAEILQSLPKERLDSKVSEEHIAEIARQMKTWELYMPDLLGEDAEAEEEEIKHDHKNNYGLQKLEALRRWKGKFGSSATYRRLIVMFCKVKKAELAEKVKQLLVASGSNAESAFSTGILAEYREYLVSCYVESPHPSCIGWPQEVAETYIDLPLTEVPPQPKQGNEGLRKKVVLGELFNTEKTGQRRKVFLIEGPAGCGKTTLTWHACREWAAGRLFPNVNLLIRLSLDDHSLHSAKSLADLIPHESSKMREDVANEIARLSGKGVFFLVDAWDEAPSSVQRKGSYVYRFISGSSLPHCSIIITSRPVAAGLLYPLLTARVVVGGFDRDRIAQFADASLGHSSAAKKELNRAFQINPRLLGLCNLPINAAIVLYLLQLQTPCSKLPSTQTGLFYALVVNLLLRHMQLRTTHGLVEIIEFEDMPESVVRMFRSVCTLAFHGVIESKTQFAFKDLKALSIDPPLDTLGLLQAPRQLTERGPQHSYTFLHSAVQEFLAAYHISKLSSEEQSKVVHQILHNKPLSLVLPFYAGLNKLSNSSVCSILMEVAKKPLDFRSHTHRMVQNPDSESSDSRRLLLALMNCIYESQNKELSQHVDLPANPEAMETLNGSVESIISFHSLRLEPTDCLSIGYFFASKQLDIVCHLDFSHCSIHDVGIELLMRELQQANHHQEGGVFINLTWCEVSHDGMKSISEVLRSPASAIFGLALIGCWKPQITNIRQALKYLTEGLSRNTSCKELSLHECYIDYTHIYHLVVMIAFSKLKVLDLHSNPNLKVAIPLLAGVLKYNTSLVDLHLRTCGITDKYLTCLGKALKTNSTLDGLALNDNPFSSAALEEFLEGLADHDSKSVLQNLAVDISEHFKLMYHDKSTNQYRFYKAPRCIQWWGHYELVDEYTATLINFAALPQNLRIRETS